MLNNMIIKKLYDTGGECKGLPSFPSILKLGGACLLSKVLQTLVFTALS